MSPPNILGILFLIIVPSVYVKAFGLIGIPGETNCLTLYIGLNASRAEVNSSAGTFLQLAYAGDLSRPLYNTSIYWADFFQVKQGFRNYVGDELVLVATGDDMYIVNASLVNHVNASWLQPLDQTPSLAYNAVVNASLFTSSDPSHRDASAISLKSGPDTTASDGLQHTTSQYGLECNKYLNPDGSIRQDETSAAASTATSSIATPAPFLGMLACLLLSAIFGSSFDTQ